MYIFKACIFTGRDLHSDPSNATFIENCGIGAFSGLFTFIVDTPAERIKCLLQIQKYGTSDASLDVLKKVYKEGKIRGIYRGMGATILRGMDTIF